MNYRALDNIGYMLNGEFFQLNKNANISQEIALKYFKTQGVIDGLVDDGRLEVVGISPTKKVKEGLAEIAESIVETVKDFGKK